MDGGTPRTAGRLAPSPTGALHVGNARTFLITWLAARSAGQNLWLRWEDIDSPRVKPGAVEQALADLRWLGLDWDGEPIYQSRRLPRYAEALQRLRTAERVYPCTCSRADIERAASAPHPGQEGPIYPGTCAGRRAVDADALAGRPVAWRFRVTHSPTFTDGSRGHVAIDLRAAGGDFVVGKADGTPAYQLAVVVDDADTGVTEVIRGDDLLSSTPRQLLLYETLERTPPRFTHVPLVLGPDGQRLAKRHGDTSLTYLRTHGVLAEALLGLLARSCGWQADERPVTARELLRTFDRRTIPPGPWVLQGEDLRRIGCAADPK